MKRHGTVAIVFAIAACCCGTRARTPEAVSQLPIFAGYGDLTWNRIIPDLGTRSPEIAILRVDPTTQATQLMIRTPSAIHVRKHWHTANETHTMIRGNAVLECDGQRAQLGPGSFNFMPAKMVHEAWLPADSLTFITVDRAWDINWVEGAPAGSLTRGRVLRTRTGQRSAPPSRAVVPRKRRSRARAAGAPRSSRRGGGDPSGRGRRSGACRPGSGSIPSCSRGSSSRAARCPHPGARRSSPWARRRS